MSKQSYVLQSPTGSFLKGVSAWRKELTDDLQEARVYTSKGAANNSRNHIPRYAKGSITELTAAYHALQEETVSNIPMPPVSPRAEVAYIPHDMAKSWSVRWGIDPYRAEMRMRENPFLRMGPEGSHIEAQEVAKAFHDVFHREYVPQLWEATAAAFDISAAQAERAA